MSDKRDLLIEIGTEDLPARFASGLADEFGHILCQQLSAVDLAFRRHKVFCTPRRLAVIVEDLERRQRDQHTERKGPFVAQAFDNHGQPTGAATGFARACGVAVHQLEQVQEANGARLTFRQQRPGQHTIELLPQLLKTAISKLHLPKRMRWNQTAAEFIRPVRWLLIILGSETVAANLFDQAAGNVTYGHRFHSPQPILIKRASAYKKLLQSKGHVLADFKQRRQHIHKQINALSATVGGKPAYSQELLDEITNLVEWPRALLGSFDEKFLDIQKAVLMNIMQQQQKYIPLVDDNDLLLPKFIVISNLQSSSPDVVMRGNEKVIVPRFEDAMFFWRRDKCKALVSRLETLKSVVFEKQLGSLFDKTRRIGNLAQFLRVYTNAGQRQTRLAAELSKCDLLTEMVGEFPKLQGIIGHQLALGEGIEPEVARAIEEQYLPRYAGDVLPASAVGITLALADRLDTLVGIFAVGKKPTGLKDPYGLRRAALAVLRISIETKLHIDLRASLQQAAACFPAALHATGVTEKVLAYIMERLRGYFSERGVAPDVIDAVLMNRPTDPSDVAARIDALRDFLELPQAANLAATNKRIHNILRNVDCGNLGPVQQKLLKEAAERTLHARLQALTDTVETLFQQRQYQQALSTLTALHQPVDAFFDNVMVMDKDTALRTNRLALLAHVDSLLRRVANLSGLQL